MSLWKSNKNTSFGEKEQFFAILYHLPYDTYTTYTTIR